MKQHSLPAALAETNPQKNKLDVKCCDEEGSIITELEKDEY